MPYSIWKCFFNGVPGHRLSVSFADILCELLIATHNHLFPPRILVSGESGLLWFFHLRMMRLGVISAKNLAFYQLCRLVDIHLFNMESYLYEWKFYLFIWTCILFIWYRNITVFLGNLFPYLENVFTWPAFAIFNAALLADYNCSYKSF